jgi:hypothetical protein
VICDFNGDAIDFNPKPGKQPEDIFRHRLTFLIGTPQAVDLMKERLGGWDRD